MSGSDKLRIVHCFRAPVGGVFRHVRDLVAAQHAAGHPVGMLCDSTTGGAFEDGLLDEMRPQLDLGLIRVPMRRAVTPGDALTLIRAYREMKRLRPDIIHCHGAKGGAYGRIIGAALRLSGLKAKCIYTPHGGSIHYDPASLQGRLYFLFERLMERATSQLIFVSQYEADGYAAKIGVPHCPQTIVRNGLAPPEFEPVEYRQDAADFLCIGEIRDLKGTDVFIRALAAMRDNGRPATGLMVGNGPDEDKCLAMIDELGLKDTIQHHDPMPARKAFAMARTIVVPSRAESLPYVVLEAIAAGMPIVATRVGGIPEIFGEESGILVEPDNTEALCDAMIAARDDPERENKAASRREALQTRFTVAKMAADVEAVYLACFQGRSNNR